MRPAIHAVALAVLGCLTALPAQPQAAGRPAVVFAEGVPARQKELLGRYAETVARWAMVQRVVAAVAAQSAQPRSREAIAEVDRAWRAGEDPEGLVASLSTNDCAVALQTLLGANPGYVEAFATDQYGAVACMSQRTGAFYHGDEERWRRAYNDGAGGVFVAAAAHDQTIGSEVVRISVPVRAAGRTVGVLTVARVAGGG